MFNEIKTDFSQPEFKKQFGAADFENLADKNESRLKSILKGADEYTDFYESCWAEHVGDNCKYGFSKFERDEMMMLSREIKTALNNIIKEESDKSEKFEIHPNSNIKHILSNEVLLAAGITADRYAREKRIYANDDKKIKEMMSNLNFYLKEVLINPELLKQELTLKKGYLESCSSFVNGELPTGSSGLLLLFKFFRELQSGKIKNNDLEAKIGILSAELEKIKSQISGFNENYFNLEEIKKAFYGEEVLN